MWEPAAGKKVPRPALPRGPQSSKHRTSLQISLLKTSPSESAYDPPGDPHTKHSENGSRMLHMPPNPLSEVGMAASQP